MGYSYARYNNHAIPISDELQMSKADHREQYAVFAGVLRAVRKKSNLTQKEVAKRLGRPQSFVSKYEGSERMLDVIDLLDVANALEVPWSSILEEVERRLAEMR